MSHAQDIIAIDVGGETAGMHPAPVMPSACQSGSCGCATPDPRVQIAPPSFSKVSVNGIEIAAEAIAQEMQHHPAPDGETAWRHAARALALRELLRQEADRLNIASQPEPDDSGARENDEDALIRTLLEQAPGAEAVTENECLRFYQGHVHRFRTPDLFEASHILVEPDADADDDAAWAAAAARARAIAAEAGQDPQRFAEAARVHSRCPTAAQGGSLGQIRRGELVAALEQVLAEMTPGSVHDEPIRSRFGWHLVRLHRRMEGQTLPFELVRDKIADMLEARAWTARTTRYLALLADAATVEGISLEPTAHDM